MKFWSRAHSVGFSIPQIPDEVRESCFENSKCQKLDGRYVASELLKQCHSLAQKHSTVPTLAVLLVGNVEASQVYVRNKVNAFARAGLSSHVRRLQSEEVSTKQLIEIVRAWNADKNVHGILVQLPLPSHVDADAVLAAIHVAKDVDGFHPENLGKLAMAREDATLACTPFGVMVLLAAYGVEARGKTAVVVGRSTIVGKPMSLLLLNADATVTTAHRHTLELAVHSRTADIVIAAVGKSELIGPEHLKPGAVVVDVGINRNQSGKLVGDVSSTVISTASALTPVPGGVGPMTIAMLCINTSLAAWGTQIS